MNWENENIMAHRCSKDLLKEIVLNLVPRHLGKVFHWIGKYEDLRRGLDGDILHILKELS